jgi:hypothetical protein
MASSGLMSQDVLRGALFTAIGAGAAWIGSGYGIGSTTAMGPGYFPVLIGALLAAMGLADVIRGVIAGGRRMPDVHVWPVACLACGVVGFALLIDEQGLLLAVAVLVGFAFLASRRFRVVEAILIFVVLAALSGSLFVFGLGSPASYLLPH